MKFLSAKAKEISKNGYKFLFIDGCYETDNPTEINILSGLSPQVITIKTLENLPIESLELIKEALSAAPDDHFIEPFECDIQENITEPKKRTIRKESDNG